MSPYSIQVTVKRQG